MIKEIAKALAETKAQIDSLTKQKAAQEEKLLSALQSEISGQLKGKDYGCGTATIEKEGLKIKVVVSKKVKWNNDDLAAIYKQVEAAGHNPGVYIKTSYDVSETSYKSWPAEIQKAFEPAREVTPGKPSITIEEV